MKILRNIAIVAVVLVSAALSAGALAQNMLPVFKALDLNNDTVISQAEFEQLIKNYPKLDEKWEKFDQNQDGNLNEDEFALFEADVMPAE